MSQVRRGAIISYITVLFNIVTGLFFTPFMIEKVGSGMYGVYTLVMTFVSYFLLDFGLGNSVAKFLSEYRAKEEYEKAGQFVSVVLKLFCILAAVIGIILFVLFCFVDSFFQGLTNDELLLLKEMYFISAISSVTLFVFIPLDGILTAYELFTELKICELSRKILFIILSIAVLAYRPNIVLIVVVNAVVGIVIVSMKLWVVVKKTDLKIAWNYFDIRLLREVGSFSTWLTVIMVAQRFIIPIAPTILGRFSNSVEISIFSIASTIEGYIYTIAACLNGMFIPKLTQFKVQKRENDINKLFVQVGRFQVYIIGTVITALAIFGQEFIGVWVGNEFAKAYYVIMLIVPPGIVVYAQEIANSMMMIENKMRYKAGCYLIGAGVSTSIACILSSKLGSIGAAIGIAVCLWGCQVFAMNLIYKRILFLDIKLFFKSCYLKSVPLFFLLGIFGYIVNQYFVTNSIVILALKIVVFVFAIVLLIWCFLLNQDEKQTVKEIMIIR